MGYVHAHHLRYKAALACIHRAQGITSELDQSVPRNKDFILAVNLITAYVLLKIGRPRQSLAFLSIAEKMAK